MKTSQPIRSRGGCRTCRARRKKCDEQKPICLRCKEGGHECLGYEAPQPRKKRPQLSTPQTQSGLRQTFLSPSQIVPLQGERVDYQNTVGDAPTEEQRIQNESLNRDLLEARLGVCGDETSAGLALEIRVGKIFANDFWNNLMDVYSSWHAQFISDIPGTHAFIAETTRQKAMSGGVLRQGLLAHASLFLSWVVKSSKESWKQQALLFNSTAQSLLDQELQNPALPLSRKFSSLLEVYMFEFSVNSCRAKSSQLLLKKGASLLSSHGFAIINLAQFASLNVQAIETTLFAWADIISSIFLARPTLFHYDYTLEKSADPGKMQVMDRILCCSGIIGGCLSRISHLRPVALADLILSEELSEGTLNAARVIESDLRSCRARYSDTLSREALVILSAQECWRFAALIHLYQAVHLVGPLHPVVVDSLRQLMAAIRLIPIMNIAERGLATPYFIAGSVAVSQKDRVYIRQRLSMFPWLPDNRCMQVLEEVWALSDLTGKPIHWSVVAGEQAVPM